MILDLTQLYKYRDSSLERGTLCKVSYELVAELGLCMRSRVLCTDSRSPVPWP